MNRIVSATSLALALTTIACGDDLAPPAFVDIVSPSNGDSPLTGNLTTVNVTAPSAESTQANAHDVEFDAIVNADGYDIWFALPGGFVSNITVSSDEAGCPTGSGTCSVEVDAGGRSGRGALWVRAFNESGSAAWTRAPQVRYVVTGNVPAPATPNDLVTTTTPDFTWVGTGDATYQLWVRDSNGVAINTTFTDNELGCLNNGETCTATPGVGLAFGDVRWWVRVAGQQWSQGLSFRVANNPLPVAPEWASPSEATTVVGTGATKALTFDWAGAGIEGNTLEVFYKSTGRADGTEWDYEDQYLINDDISCNGTECTWFDWMCDASFDEDATIWFRGINDAGEGPWSAPRRLICTGFTDAGGGGVQDECPCFDSTTISAYANAASELGALTGTCSTSFDEFINDSFVVSGDGEPTVQFTLSVINRFGASSACQASCSGENCSEEFPSRQEFNLSSEQINSCRTALYNNSICEEGGFSE